MLRVPVRSRTGNVLVAIIGTVYAISSMIVLIWFVRDVGDAAGLKDRMFQAWLLLSAVCGIWFIAIAVENLGLSLRGLHHFGRTSTHVR